MGEMITKPDTNPIMVALLNCIFLLGYFTMGQKKKWMIGLAVVFGTTILSCGTLGWIPALIFIYDGYLVAQKLANNQSVGMNENGLPFLDAIFKD